MASLTLAIIVLSQLVGFAVSQWMPPPGWRMMNFTQAVDALKDPARAQRFGLKIEHDDDFTGTDAGAWLARAAAERLHLPQDQVRGRAMNRATNRTPERPLHNGADPQIAAAGEREEEEVDRELLLSRATLIPFQLSVRQADGSWLTVGPLTRAMDEWRQHVLYAFVLSDLLLMPLAWVLVQRLTGPLKRFADGAERASLINQTTPIPLEGPYEIRVATTAMNAMLARLHAQSADITWMLAAVAHDLRTPLTSLRLRAETSPAGQRERMVRDIQRMKAMITQVLDYAQGQTNPEVRIQLDLQALINSTVAEARSLSRSITSSVIPHVVIQGEALGLRRALSNLVENAVRYGGNAHISLLVEKDEIWLQVEDEGPGIPADQVERLQQPFQRLEASRNANTGGVGLGLAIAFSTADRHGGQLVLGNRSPKGLCARIVLPRGALEG